METRTRRHKNIQKDTPKTQHGRKDTKIHKNTNYPTNTTTPHGRKDTKRQLQQKRK